MIKNNNTHIRNTFHLSNININTYDKIDYPFTKHQPIQEFGSDITFFKSQ